ncbi:MAG: flagellar motor protein MotB [Alteromonadaceae bacterium]|nr:flagellar motor protein MotB [Alteromonadaceae bacterium]MBL4910343.1 flagellar motor protein MotB [Alteromonadaceae bacterium]
MADEAECKCPPPGLPAWMGTFADLMSLLMCFFVLLLSFSEMDVLKFKQIAGSMKFAFGVQNKIEVKDIPKGTSIIAQEFRPGKPEPTPIELIQQQTHEMTQQMLNFQAGEEADAGGRQEQRGDERGGQSQSTDDSSSSAQSLEQAQQAVEQAQQDQMNELVKKIAQQLEKQIQDGAVELESLGQQIIIRIRENGSFPSGSAFLQPKFKPIIKDIGKLLNNIPGEVMISGNTDDREIHTELYNSNWQLSAERAVAIAQELIKVPGFDPTRLLVVGHADTRPLVPNTNALNRRRNRRVEIAINQGKAKESEAVSVLE